MKPLMYFSTLFSIVLVLLPHLANADLTTMADSEKSASVVVYKSPTCGCCSGWVDHLKQTGFHPIIKHPENLNNIKTQLDIAPENQSCHTAVKEGFVFEGHIPAKYIQKFLENPPKNAKGLAVPGMPMGSPGMEMGSRFTPYTIYQLENDGSRSVFANVTNMLDQY